MTIQMNNIPAETDEEVLKRIQRMVRRAGEFALGFVRCNSVLQRMQISAALKERLADNRFLEITLDTEIVSLLDQIKQRWDAATPPDLVCVYGMEKSITQGYSPVLGRLNNDRDLLRKACPVPLLIWLPDFALDSLVRYAPDFWAWRSGVYEFPTDPILWQRDGSSAIMSESSDFFALSHRNLPEEIAYVEELVRAARSLPQQGQREHGLLASLLDRLGDLVLRIGNTQAAQRYYADGLTIRKRLYEADPTNAGFARDLSISYIKLGNLAGGTDTAEGRIWLKHARNLLRVLKTKERMPDVQIAEYLDWLEQNLSD